MRLFTNGENVVYAASGDGSGHTGTAEDQAYQYLLDGICRGRHPQGTHLVAEEVAAELQMSRMPVRGAFKRLAAENLLTLRPNRGAVVSGLNREQMCEVFEMRSVLEGLAIRIAVSKLTEKHLTHLTRLLDSMDDTHNEPYEWVLHHRVFHEYLCSLSERPRLLRQISLLNSSISPYMHLWRQRVNQPQNDREDHRQIIDALRTGDPVLAEQIIRHHVEGTIPLLTNMLP
ncbi:GntR family transcriptional regulator [Dickeya zeae]|jgi:DNA-binding GntR family transcriptional regulator|uniref:GntR family transcriptional regulator n=1 Tax=Dickeya zeae TaxID=204042 RepID=UPI00036FEDCA|nr:GntR family transcriptional regulator [Dickeya zeae]AUQ27001.1 GntR family transcriptional regulator [Dickeya zeae]